MLDENGLFAAPYAIAIKENALRDGSRITNKRLSTRYIPLVIELAQYSTAVALREELIHFFAPYFDCILYVTRDNITRKISGIISNVADDIENIHDYYRINFEMLCPDPYFTDVEDTSEKFMQYEPLMWFPLTFVPNTGMTTGLLKISDGIRITNSGDVPIGVVITIKATGGIVVNPKILCGDKFVQIERTLDTDDIVEISTVAGKKFVKINGVRTPRWERQSKFFSLNTGINDIKVEAEDETITNAEIAITYMNKYFGV